MEDFQPVVINEEQEEKFIKESIKKEYSIDVPARLIRMVIDAQLEYMESIGLIDKGE